MEREIVEVQPDSDVYTQVLELWRSHSGTLGFMPEGGFHDHASKKCLLALCEGMQLCGYVMFRRSNDRAAIVHLCTAPAHIKKGVARQLVTALRDRTKDCTEISLRCRREYEANQVWPKLHFVPMAEIAGRSKTGETLTCWRLDNGLPNLFDVSSPPYTTALRVAIDANIFFDLSPTSEQENTASKALQADWLVDSIELCVTDEVFNEIDRHGDVSQRKKNRVFAQSLSLLSAPLEEYGIIAKQLRLFLKNNEAERDQDQSDFRHISKSIAAQISVFLTHDVRLQKLYSGLHAEFGLRVLSPLQLIVELDALRKD